MSSRRRIAVVTGTRAEFGLLEPVLRAMTGRQRLDVRLIATGMHLLARFGRTVDHIRAAGWRLDATVRMQSGRDDVCDEPLALARGIAGIGRALNRFRSEVVLVLGDRIEAFAGACAAVAGRRVLAHIHGGDRGIGDVDDMLRNAITRLAHVHLVASQDAADRLRRMGEEPRRIHQVGAPGLDDIRMFRESADAAGSEKKLRAKISARKNARRESFAGSRSRTRIPVPPYALIIQHPIGQGARREAAVMSRILAAVEAGGLGGVIIYPNSDPGHEGILSAIGQQDGRPGWKVIRSLPRPEYLRIARDAAIMVGNSSSGIIESASLGLNAVNIGPRQQSRLRCGKNVIDCTESPTAIRRAIRLALARPRPRVSKSVYGDGRAGERIAAILERLIISPRLTRKTLDY